MDLNDQMQIRMHEQGESMAKALNLRKAKDRYGKPYDPPRYLLGQGNTFTAVGVFNFVHRLAKENP